jgi:tRNA(Leu) C34 or U34 (ribose-2'-O)-methylase TrmL
MRAPGVVLIDPKFSHNVGATIRACSCFGIESFVWTGSRIELSKYQRLPREERMKGYKSVQFENHQRPFDLFDHFTPVCVEVYEQSEPLTTFEHPENALYVFGPGDGKVPQVVRRLCHRFVHIPAHFLEPERGCERCAGAPLDFASDGGEGADEATSGDASRSARGDLDASNGRSWMGRKVVPQLVFAGGERGEILRAKRRRAGRRPCRD